MHGTTVKKSTYVRLNVLRAHLGVRGGVNTVHNLTRVRISTLAPPTAILYKHRINKRDV